MDIIHIFNDELQSLLGSKPPVSKAKMGIITKAAMKGIKFYKHIVQSVEKFIARSGPEYKVPGLYVIDSIVRQSRHQFGVDRDVYAARFARNLGITFENLFSGCLPDDKSRIVRVLNLWQKNGVFSMRVIQPLLDMANPSMSNALQRDPKSPSSSGDTTSSSRQDLATANYESRRYSSSMGAGGDEAGLRFSKNMLDFDYGEEDDADETPTEAEPRLSSTLSKLEKEQRAKKTNENAPDNSISYQSSHIELKTQQPNQDPVLERWNRIIKGDLASEQLSFENNNSTPILHRRSCSRSPTAGPLSQPYPQQHRSFNRTSFISTPNREPVTEQSEHSESSSRHGLERATELITECTKERERHVPKSVSEADISDTFGEFGTINSIDLIPPRGCAYVCMDRRQDAKRALGESRHLRLNGSPIKMAWAPGKGLKEHKKLKDFWESDVGASFIPYSRIDASIDFNVLEEGGVIDEDSMSLEMRERCERKLEEKDKDSKSDTNQSHPRLEVSQQTLPMFTQPPPSSTSIQPYTIPPPPLNLGIPPPLMIGQGIIPFPPPGVSLATTSNHILLPPPPISTNAQSESSEPRDIEQHLSMTERQIGMIDQQLSMLQQGQGLGQQVQLGQHPNQAIFFHPNQPDPMIFDFRPAHPQMIHMVHPMLDPHQMAMFDGQPHPFLLGQTPSMLPINQGSLIDLSNLDENFIAHQHGDF